MSGDGEAMATLPDRLRYHARLHPESAELLREAADLIQRQAQANTYLRGLTRNW